MEDHTVYLLHFNRRYKHAGHYLGSTKSLTKRLAEHESGRGARLLEVVYAVGITWVLARTWEGGKQRERQLKKQGGASRFCPICKGRPLTQRRTSHAVSTAVTARSHHRAVSPEGRATATHDTART